MASEIPQAGPERVAALRERQRATLDYRRVQRKADRRERQALSLRNGLERLSFLRALMTLWPSGFVPLPTAARILGVRRQRVRELIRTGRLPASVPMPGGTGYDRFIPIDALLAAPAALDEGRPLGWRLGKDTRGKPYHRPNPWVDAMADPQSAGILQIPSQLPPLVPKSLLDNGLEPESAERLIR